MTDNDKSIYEIIGGEPTFQRLVDDFYARIEADDALRRLFPSDLEPGKRYQKLFLMQYFGGPQQYSDERGHPRLRMRHNPYPIDVQAGASWLAHMLAAIDAVGIAEPARSKMRQYFERAAPHIVNTYSPDE